jgi:hypothetical protein
VGLGSPIDQNAASVKIACKTVRAATSTTNAAPESRTATLATRASATPYCFAARLDDRRRVTFSPGEYGDNLHYVFFS